MQTREIDYTAIEPGDNDRKVFEPEALAKLAKNIGANGLLQPIVVRSVAKCQYQIIVGERRYRAIGLLGWAKVPCIVRSADDRAASSAMLSENTARQNLDAIEEAQAYQSRIDQFGISVEEVASWAGVSTTRVLFRLKLLKLREDIQALIRSENMPLGYAQILSDADLDRNRQSIAVDRLNANTAPTPAWFRRECGELSAQQSQVAAFDLDDPELFGQAVVALGPESPSFLGMFQLAAPKVEPVTPGHGTPPAMGGTAEEVTQSHAAFWREQALEWDRRGKNFKRDECLAAARALETVLAALAGK